VKIILIPLFAIILISSIQYVEAGLDLDNKQLVSNDDSLIVEFGETSFQYFSTFTKTLPSLDLGIIQLIDRDILLESSDSTVKVLGNSIVIKSFENEVVVYARNIGGNDYRINVYTFDRGFVKQTFTGSLESIQTPVISQEQVQETELVQEKLPELIMLVEQDIRTFWRDYYTISAKVFDATLNPTPQFHDGFGSIDGVDISVTITPEDESETYKLEGTTHSRGFFEGEQYFPENLSIPGKYFVNIVAYYKGAVTSQNLETFLLGEVKGSDSGNRIPIANAGPDQAVGTSVVTLDGSASFDPEGNPLTFSWVFSSVPDGSGATLSNAGTNSPTFTADVVGSYVVSLTVSDARKTAGDSVTITVA